MKKLIFSLILLLIIIPNFLKAQDIKVHNFIGKPLKEAISNYGKPVHQDKSIPEMVSTFFQQPNRSYIFISDGDSVYQAQATITYPSKDEAQNAVTNFINELIKNEFVSDTLSAEKFMLHKEGSSIETESSSITNGKYQLKIVARKTEN